MIYIQSNTERTLAHHFDCACALYGAIDSALDYRLTSFEEVESGKFDALIKKNLFVGSVEFMQKVFSRIGLEDVRLPQNSNRSSQIITLDQAKKIVKEQNKKLFIKPVYIKLFTGFVLDQSDYTSIHNVPGDTLVYAYEPFSEKVLSEWRTYIHNNQIVDIKNYSGDLFEIPSQGFIEYIIKENKELEFPNNYIIDVGILDSPFKDNVVIEYNDMWAIGNYGIPNDIYLRMLKDRYFEIIRSTVPQYT